jgi:hypothetical protein
VGYRAGLDAEAKRKNPALEQLQKYWGERTIIFVSKYRMRVLQPSSLLTSVSRYTFLNIRQAIQAENPPLACVEGNYNTAIRQNGGHESVMTADRVFQRKCSVQIVTCR